MNKPITIQNYDNSFLVFGDRQAGVSLTYCPFEKKYFYNVYCFDMKILKELFSVEHDFLEDAIIQLNDEFGSWELKKYEEKKDCGSCSAKTK